MEDIILKCERIEKKYSKTKALDNINLSIYTGHIYALIGENGAGKTTLMRIICIFHLSSALFPGIQST